MPKISLLLSFFYVLISIFGFCLFHKKHYWKILLVTSITFFILLAGKGFLLILALALLTYYYSLNISLLKTFKWWMIGIILIPLLIKKIFVSEYQFDILTSQTITIDSIINVIGLSYITFNAIGYLIDVKRKYIEPETNFFKLLFFLIYFPIIFSGPLTRAKHFFSQIRTINLKNESIINGLRLILWGLFKNLVIGVRLFNLLNMLKNLNLTGPYYLFNGLVFYLFLYCTFSSFINIFQGISLLFNIEINDNFKNRIYLSSSREQFWKGWHITLNNWFRDYFFYELIRFDKERKNVNILLFITFLCIALWHDFTLVFLTWGALNAIWLIAERKYKKHIKLKPKYTFVGIIYHTFLASVLASIFISENIFTLFTTLFDFSYQEYPLEKLIVPNTFIVLVLFGFMDFYERKTADSRIDKYLAKQSIWHRYFFYYVLCFLILFFAVNSRMINYYNLF
jgi:alginate O-acetyltransferase complex protein AlgI